MNRLYKKKWALPAAAAASSAAISANKGGKFDMGISTLLIGRLLMFRPGMSSCDVGEWGLPSTSTRKGGGIKWGAIWVCNEFKMQYLHTYNIKPIQRRVQLRHRSKVIPLQPTLLKIGIFSFSRLICLQGNAFIKDCKFIHDSNDNNSLETNWEN